MSKRFILLLPVITSLLLSCGWQLEGSRSGSSAEAFTLVLNSQDIYTPLYRTCKRVYEKHRVDLVSDHAPRLKLLQENISNRTVSLNTELDPAEETLMMTVQYEVTLPGQAAQIFSTQSHKTLVLNKNRAAARDSERERLLEEMRIEIAERILSQVMTASSAKNMP